MKGGDDGVMDPSFKGEAGSDEFDWVVLSNGARVQVPRLPPQQADDSTGAAQWQGGVGTSEKGFHLLEKVRSAWGSTAGAGSDFFHVYRKQRAREMARQEELEKAWVEEEEFRKFQERRIANFKADEERARKRNEKRKRKKQALAAKREQSKKQKMEDSASEQQGEHHMADTRESERSDDVPFADDHPRSKGPVSQAAEGSLAEEAVDLSQRDNEVGDKLQSEQNTWIRKDSEKPLPRKSSSNVRPQLAVIDDGDESF